MEDQFQVTKTIEAPSLTFKDLLFKYIRFLPLFVISLALSLLVAYIYLRYTSPIYESKGALLVKEDNGGGSTGGGDRFQQMFVLDNSINIKNEIEILKSRPLMKRVVERLQLNFTYYVIGKIKESNIYTASPFKVEVLELADSNTAFALKIDVEDNHRFRLNDATKLYVFGQVFEIELGRFRLSYNPLSSFSNTYRVEWQPTESVVSAILNKMAIAPGGAAGLIQISYEAPNAQLAADLINVLMKEYQVATREDKNETNKRMLEFIDGRLDGVQGEMDSITRVMLQFQRDNNLLTEESQGGTYLGKIAEGDLEINKLRAELTMADMIDNYLRNQSYAYDLVPSNFKLSDGTLNNLIAGYNVAQLERKGLIDSKIPETNPLVKQKEDLVERLRLNIFESIKNLKGFLNISLNRWQRQNNSAILEVRSLPLKEQRLLEIKAQKEMKEALVNLLLEKKEQTSISLAGTISNMKVIEDAAANPIPIKPKPTTIYLICFVVGLALPALFVFGMEALNDKVTTRQDIEKITDIAIIGEVGHSFLEEPLVVKPNQRGIVAEQFRIIRSNLQYILPKTPNPVLLVTSSFSGEGKSFLSTNLGAVMSLANKKTIILEFDIRKPKILSHIGIPKKPGITNYMLGKISLEELPIPVPGYENLFVLACGPIPPNPSELLLEPQLEDLFSYLKKNFDVIVIDTAPIGMVSDAMALSRFADASLYVVRQGHTFKKQIHMINEFSTQGKLPKVSIIMNDVKQQIGYGYYGYGRYGYGYGYAEKSGYFTADAPPPSFWNKWFKWMDMKKWDKKKNA